MLRRLAQSAAPLATYVHCWVTSCAVPFNTGCALSCIVMRVEHFQPAATQPQSPCLRGWPLVPSACAGLHPSRLRHSQPLRPACSTTRNRAAAAAVAALLTPAMSVSHSWVLYSLSALTYRRLQASACAWQIEICVERQ